MSSTILSKGLSKLSIVNSNDSPSDHDYIKFLNYEELEERFDIHKYYPQYIHNGGISTPEIKELIADKPIYAMANKHVPKQRTKKKQKDTGTEASKLNDDEIGQKNVCGASKLLQGRAKREEYRRLLREQHEERRDLRRTQRQDRRNSRRGVHNEKLNYEDEGDDPSKDKSFRDSDASTFVGDEDDKKGFNITQSDLSKYINQDDGDDDLLAFKNPFGTDTSFSIGRGGDLKDSKVGYNGIYLNLGQNPNGIKMTNRTLEGPRAEERRRSSLLSGLTRTVPNNTEVRNTNGESRRSSVSKSSNTSGNSLNRLLTGIEQQIQLVDKESKNSYIPNKILSFVKRKAETPEDSPEYGVPLTHSNSFDQTKSAMTDTRSKSSKLLKLKLNDRRQRRVSEQIGKYFYLKSLLT